MLWGDRGGVRHERMGWNQEVWWSLEGMNDGRTRTCVGKTTYSLRKDDMNMCKLCSIILPHKQPLLWKKQYGVETKLTTVNILNARTNVELRLSCLHTLVKTAAITFGGGVGSFAGLLKVVEERRSIYLRALHLQAYRGKLLLDLLRLPLGRRCLETTESRRP